MVRNPVVADPRQADMPPSFGLRRGWPGCSFLSAFLFHEPGPARSSVSAPASQLLSARAGYACCVVWKEAFASSCRQSSFLLRKAAVADALLDGLDTVDISTLQGPRQRTHGPKSR